MSWRSKLLAVILLLLPLFFYGQVKGAPPGINYFTKLENTEAALRLQQKILEDNDSSAPLRILHLGDSHVKSGFFSEAFADSLNRFFYQSGRDSAVLVKVMAKNGATSKHFLEYVYSSGAVQEFKPDVVIISLGTNEAQNLYTGDDLTLYFEQLYNQVIKDAPEATLLFTLPGDARRKTTKTIKRKKKFYTITAYTENKNLQAVVNFLKTFAAEKKAAFWNWNTAMGGKGSIVRWVAHRYAKDDYIHLLEPGYILQGQLLASAFISYIRELTAQK